MAKYKVKKKGIIVWAIAMITLVLIINGVPYLEKLLSHTEIIENGQMEVSKDVIAYIVRDETVYGAPYSGILTYLAAEGQLEKKNTKVISMEQIPETAEEKEKEAKAKERNKDKYAALTQKLGEQMVVMEGFNTQRKGIVSYYVDGNEALLNLTDIEDIGEAQISELHTNPVDIKRKEAYKGEPVFKIADNSTWKMMFWAEAKDSLEYEEGGRVTVKFTDGEIRATVEKIKKEGTKVKVILSTNRYYENFAKLRKIKIKVITTKREGLIINKKAITKKDGKEGVYVVDTLGDSHFVQISIVAEDGQKILVRSGAYYDEEGQGIETLNPYDKILMNPQKEK